MQFTPEMIGIADQIYMRSVEEIALKQGEELRAVMADISSRNIVKSGINVANQMQVHETFLRRIVEARVRSLVTVLQQANKRLTQEDVDFIMDRASEVAARAYQGISDIMAKVVQEVGVPLPADWVKNNLERTTSSVIATNRRNLNIEKGMQSLAVQSAHAAGRHAFVVMSLRMELDRLFADVIVPAISQCDLEPYRVDREEFEETINQTILEKIGTSRIVVADLTFERPNCYFEIGYAMAIKKPLILTAREDHDPRRPLRKPDEPKVHFDLDTHKITFWNSEDLESFRDVLTERIKKHLT